MSECQTTESLVFRILRGSRNICEHLPSLGFPEAKKNNPVSMKGVLLIQWSDETRFIYVPPTDNPLRFTNSKWARGPTWSHVHRWRLHSTRILVGQRILTMGIWPGLCSARLAVSSTSLRPRWPTQ